MGDAFVKNSKFFNNVRKNLACISLLWDKLTINMSLADSQKSTVLFVFKLKINKEVKYESQKMYFEGYPGSAGQGGLPDQSGEVIQLGSVCR